MNRRPIICLRVENNADLVLIRQRAQTIAELAGFDTLRQTSFATALSEIARNALQFAAAGRVTFSIDAQADRIYLAAQVEDNGPGIREIRDHGGSWNGAILPRGHGIASARRLVKIFAIDCPPAGGTTVKIGIPFPEGHLVSSGAVASWTACLIDQKPRNVLEEITHRNQELLNALEALQLKEAELQRQMAQDAVLRKELAESHDLLEARVAERTASLLLSNQELRAFSYTVSHDLRAPLRAINGFVQILLECHLRPDDADAAELAQGVVQASSRMDSLIQDLVAYTQITKVPIPLHPVDSRKLIDELLCQSESHPRPENASFETLGQFPLVAANPAILQNALSNLVENALKFRKPNSGAAIVFRGDPNGKNLRIWVEDDGIGIAPDHHKRIFLVFERLHGREIPGTGIGLALVRRWVAAMNGSVGVESDLGQGARFWIELPLVSELAA